MTTLHRCLTPTNRLCPCGRVERELRKSGVAHATVRVPLWRRRRADVEARTGQRAVPVLELDGEPIVDSRRIVEHLRWRAAQSAPPAPGA